MSKGAGWDSVFDQIVENAKELKALEHENPDEFARFRETQIAALKNRNLEIGGASAAGGGDGERGKHGGGGGDDFAVED